MSGATRACSIRGRSRHLPARACEVFYYGSFLPLHGTNVILQAAALLRHRRDIRFTIGGDGVGFADALRNASDLALDNVTFAGWIPIERLPEHIARATISLGGHFSTVPKAARVVSTKTFQFIAIGKPTIVGDNSATRELFKPGEHVFAVPMGDPVALAQAIKRLTDDTVLRYMIAPAGYNVFQERLTTRVIASHQLTPAILHTLVDGQIGCLLNPKLESSPNRIGPKHGCH